ncbi:ead/Ea22-like family protein [Salmonella enterica]|nr:ead/Ea22-like family protein [Salmonella enterica]
MSNIDKQALRKVAEKATPGNWHRSSSRFNGITATPFSLCGEEVMLAHTVEKRDAEFIAAANPATMLALRDDMRQAREQLEAAEKRNAEQREYYEGVIADGSKRIAELENGHQEAAKQINSWRRLAKQNIAERGKDISELEAARQRIAELEARAVNLPKRSVGEVMHLSGFSRDYAEGWCAGNDNAMHEIRAAGIKVKGE